MKIRVTFEGYRTPRNGIGHIDRPECISSKQTANKQTVYP